MTGLRNVEQTIHSIQHAPCPYGLPETPHIDVQFLDPKVWANRLTRASANAVANSTIRVTLSIPCTIYDLGMAVKLGMEGKTNQSYESLKDASVNIPKTAAHLLVDTAIVVGSVGFTVFAVGGATLYTTSYLFVYLKTKGSDLFSKLYQA